MSALRRAASPATTARPARHCRIIRAASQAWASGTDSHWLPFSPPAGPTQCRRSVAGPSEANGTWMARSPRAPHHTTPAKDARTPHTGVAATATLLAGPDMQLQRSFARVVMHTPRLPRKPMARRLETPRGDPFVHAASKPSLPSGPHFPAAEQIAIPSRITGKPRTAFLTFP